MHFIHSLQDNQIVLILKSQVDIILSKYTCSMSRYLLRVGLTQLYVWLVCRSFDFCRSFNFYVIALTFENIFFYVTVQGIPTKTLFFENLKRKERKLLGDYVIGLNFAIICTD